MLPVRLAFILIANSPIAPAMSHRPTLVFVPGAWHGPETWNKVSAEIEAHEYKCVRVALPSTLSDPAATFADDVRAVRAAIAAETTQGRDVVVVVHSYGGHVGSSAVRGLTRTAQGAASSAGGPSGHVVGIAMMATGFTVTGVSFVDGLGGKPPPEWAADEQAGFAVIVADARALFYHDLPADEGARWVDRLRKQALKPLMEGGEHAYSGWKDVPVWFLATTEDKALPLQAQHVFVQAARDAGADVTLRGVASSHSPMLSRPKETADFILQAVASFTSR
ncbi:hypothetical protein TOPH_03530 [Tolypocladium ophioglossoides CBS 100239]|uniref:AB hydrolase-1 domain-containing protein n=1 Tax=Tolypocladium ophioglossoides (strain CBS 100239) TaxID=1163406 RepID=A0A0L0NCX8_TOLOC|nr:hypothetical protein TOPH_03530 [Tolypocladium ophioglossoides CBS 100239]